MTGTDDISETLNLINKHDNGAGKSIPVLLALIIKHQSGDNSDVESLNQYIQNMTNSRIAKGDQIIIVDQKDALTYPTDIYNTLHPTDTGHIKMAHTWLDALDKILPTCP